MLEKAFTENPEVKNLICHSEQGWQYQPISYRQHQKDKQSMSRKGTSMDNGMMESCFAY